MPPDTLHRLLVDGLLYPAWLGLSDTYKKKYSRTIWNQFEDNIRSAAYTSSLPKFLDTFSRKLGITFLADDASRVVETFAADSKTALKALRDETTLLVLLVRVKNDERKERLGYGRGKDTSNEDL